MNADHESEQASADERADLAVLDIALAEHLADVAPPDVWSRMQGNDVRSTAGTRQRPLRTWLAAALLLLGVGVVATLIVTREDPTSPSPATVPDDGPLPGGPQTLAELQERLAAATQAMVHVRRCWSEAERRWFDLPLAVAVPEAAPPMPMLSDDQFRRVVEIIGTSTVAGPCGNVAWTHEITIFDMGIVLFRTSGTQPPLMAFRSPTGAVELACADIASLQDTLTQVTRARITEFGLVLGAHGFDDIPATSPVLRPLDVPASAAHQITRFRSLRRIDLTRSPQWHRTDVLHLLDGTTLQYLMLSPDLLAHDAFPTLGSLRSLRELHLAGSNRTRSFRGEEPTLPAPTLDDAALNALTGLTHLRDLLLAGGSFSDDALRSLASLPIENLGIVDCPNVRGHALDAMHSVRSLFLRGRSFDRDVLTRVASLPEARELCVLVPGQPLSLLALSTAQKLRHLKLDAHIDRADLALLRKCSSLTTLELRLEPALRDDELAMFSDMPELQNFWVLSDLVTPTGLESLRKNLPGCRITNRLPKVW